MGFKMQNQQYLDEKGVSSLTRLALSTLRNNRHLGRGFPHIKVGRRVLYNRDDIVRFLESRKVHTYDSK